MPNHGTPHKLIEAWLDFHKNNFCQSIDAVFVFNKQGMEVWCLCEDNKDYRKWRRMLEPLSSSYRIELYTTHPPEAENPEEDPGPPPSLCENYELRAYLRDPFVRLKDRLESSEADKEIAPPDEVLKLRLLAYAHQVLEWNRRIKLYALDLPELTQVALDPEGAPDLQARAGTVCKAHAHDLLENLRKLRKNLVHALPKSTETKEVSRTEPAVDAKLSVQDTAALIAATAQKLARRVYNFIYPAQHTVDLSDLRQPSLLEALGDLESMVRRFQNEIAKPATNKQ